MTMTNEELLNVFKKTAKTRMYKLSDNTLDKYLYYIKSLIRYLDGKSILDITEEDITSYLMAINGDSYLNGNLFAFKRLYDILLYNKETRNLIKANPTTQIKSVRNVENSKEQIILSRKQQNMLLRYAKNSRDKAILITYLSTGIRACELIGLTLEQYINRDIKDGNRIDLVVTKGSYNRSIWLSEDVVEAIDSYLMDRKECEYDNLFISNGKKPMDRGCMSRTIKIIAKRSGAFTEEEIQLISNHSCRRAVASTLLNEKNVPIDVVAQFLGHHGLGSVLRYAKTNEDRIKEAMLG